MNIKDFFRGYSEADIISATNKLTGDFEPHNYIPVTSREVKAIAGEGISAMTYSERQGDTGMEEFEKSLWLIVFSGIKKKLTQGEPLSDEQQRIYDFFREKRNEY
jgi:hypothetical protein